MECTLGPGYCPYRLTSATLSSNKVIWKKHHSLPGGLPDWPFRSLGGSPFLQGDHQALGFARPIYGAVRGSGAAPDPAGSPGEPDCSLIRRRRAAERLAVLSHNRRQCAATDVSHSQARRHGEDVPLSGRQAVRIPTRRGEKNEPPNQSTQTPKPSPAVAMFPRVLMVTVSLPP